MSFFSFDEENARASTASSERLSSPSLGRARRSPYLEEVVTAVEGGV